MTQSMNQSIAPMKPIRAGAILRPDAILPDRLDHGEIRGQL